MKSSISLISNALESDSIGFKCLIFLNLFVGGEPINFSNNFNSFKKSFALSRFIISFLSLS